MKSIKITLLLLACMSFITIIGAGLYEHVCMVPKWKLAPPASLTMFRGEYGINNGSFWMSIHPVTLLLLIAALIAHWRTAGKKYIAITIIGYLLILISTRIYFVPELIAIIHTPYQPVTDQGLVARAGLWEKLSQVRLLACMVLAFTLLFSLTKGNENIKQP